jgi:hypothetical protein
MNDLDKIISIIQKDVISRLNKEGEIHSNLYIDKKIYKSGETIRTGKEGVKLNIDSIMVFIDDAPLYNWAHPCRYFFYDTVIGEHVKSINACFPPYMFNIPNTFSSFYSPAEQAATALPIVYNPPGKVGLSLINNRYALLFSGASNHRHVNDLQYLYLLLTKEFHYPPQNIFILNYNGTWQYSSFNPPVDIFPVLNIPYNMKIYGDGTRQTLNNAFAELKKMLQPDDTLFIHTNNHGDGPTFDPVTINGSGSESSICLYSPNDEVNDYTASEFGAQLAELPKYSNLIVMMEQCHSGGFLNSIMTNSTAETTCFMAACGADQTSIGGTYFNPFTHQWTNTITGDKYVHTGDQEILLTMTHKSTASAYAKAQLSVIDKDNPVIGQNPNGCADSLYLGLPPLTD